MQQPLPAHSAAQQPPPSSKTRGASRRLALSQGSATAAADHASASKLPQVSYHNGLLSITSENASLAAVLNAVRHSLGAAMDFPSAAATEPVTVNLGPAPVADVLATLLNGSRFDYIILGEPNNPAQVQLVLLREKNSAANAEGAGGNSPGIQSGFTAPAEMLPQASNDEPNGDNAEEEAAPAPEPAQQNPDRVNQPSMTPEQLLQKLKMQGLQQQPPDPQ